MVRNEGCGRPSTKVTSKSPLAFTSLRLEYHSLRGFLRMIALSSGTWPASASQVHLTSADVNNLPSCHFTPWRSLKVSCVWSALYDQLSASSGTILSGLFTFSLGSKTTRLLNTDMKGWFTEIVDSSWIEALGGLSRWEMRNVPPCFCASAGTAVVTQTAQDTARTAK